MNTQTTSTATDTRHCTKCKDQKPMTDFIKKCGMCKPCRSTHRRAYREKNIETFKAKDRKQYLAHKENHNQKSKVYYSSHTQKIKKQRLSYYKNNTEKVKKLAHDRYINNLDLRLGICYRNRVRRELKSGKGYLEYLGCDIAKLKKWFEFNFEYEGFLWDTYGKIWEIDHVIPCCKWDLKDKSQVLKCFNWKNTKPTTTHFNKSKNGKILNWQILEQQLRLHIFTKGIKSDQTLATAV